MPLRIALFGGTFDPPHLGHLAIARAAADHFTLDQILFAPVGLQPLKPEGPAASFADRLAMVTLATAADPRFLPCTLDAPAPTPNYAVDTLSTLTQLHPDAELFHLVGADSFASLARWRGPARLLELAQWIVVSRPGVPLADPIGYPLTPAQRARIHLIDNIHFDLSATHLRQRLALGDPCPSLLPPAVAAYIDTHQLYR